MNWNRVRIIEFLLFLIGWPAVLLTAFHFRGKSAVMIIILTLLIDVIQDFWLRYLSGHMVRERTFFRTLFLYVILGGATGMGLVMSDSYVSSSNAGAVMILMIMAAAGVYSIVFWLINRQLKHYEIMHLKSTTRD